MHKSTKLLESYWQWESVLECSTQSPVGADDDSTQSPVSADGGSTQSPVGADGGSTQSPVGADTF